MLVLLDLTKPDIDRLSEILDACHLNVELLGLRLHFLLHDLHIQFCVICDHLEVIPHVV